MLLVAVTKTEAHKVRNLLFESEEDMPPLFVATCGLPVHPPIRPRQAKLLGEDIEDREIAVAFKEEEVLGLPNLVYAGSVGGPKTC